MNAWQKYAADFDALSDAEIEAECEQSRKQMAPHEEWLEAVAAWKKAGKPRNGETVTPLAVGTRVKHVRDGHGKIINTEPNIFGVDGVLYSVVYVGITRFQFRTEFTVEPDA